MVDHPQQIPELGDDHILWGGHATVRIVLGGEAVLTDPVLRRRVMHLQRVVPLVDGLDRQLTAVVISHLHHDHLDVASLRMLPADVPIVVPAGARPVLGRLAGRTVIELVPGESVDCGTLTIRATPAKHDGRRAGRRSVHAPALGYLIECDVRTVYFAGDTDLFAGMDELAPRIDCALLPVWGWGPTLGKGHLDPARAAEALGLIRPRIAIPIHWGTFRPRIGRPGARAFLRTPGPRFAEAAARIAPDVVVRVIAPGERVVLAPRAA